MLLQRLRDIVSTAHVLTAPDDTAPYLIDWRRRFTGTCASRRIACRDG